MFRKILHHICTCFASLIVIPLLGGIGIAFTGGGLACIGLGFSKLLYELPGIRLSFFMVEIPRFLALPVAGDLGFTLILLGYLSFGLLKKYFTLVYGSKILNQI